MGECGCTKYTADKDGTIKIESTEYRLSPEAKEKGLDFDKLGKDFQKFTERMTNFGRGRAVTENSRPLFKIQFNPI